METAATIVDSLANKFILRCHDIYDELYGDTCTAVYLDVEDAVQSVGTEFNVESVSAICGYTNAHDYADLAALHLSNVQQPSYGVFIGCDGLCALIDSLIDGNSAAITLQAPS